MKTTIMLAFILCCSLGIHGFIFQPNISEQNYMVRLFSDLVNKGMIKCEQVPLELREFVIEKVRKCQHLSGMRQKSKGYFAQKMEQMSKFLESILVKPKPKYFDHIVKIVNHNFYQAQ